MSQIERVKSIVDRLSLKLLGTTFTIIVAEDHKSLEFFEGVGEVLDLSADVFRPRVFVQTQFIAECTNSSRVQAWKGRKWYLSDHMTDDEIIKTCFAAFKQTVEHEVMEGFSVDGIVLFNPHASYESLLRVSREEVKRED